LTVAGSYLRVPKVRVLVRGLLFIIFYMLTSCAAAPQFHNNEFYLGLVDVNPSHKVSLFEKSLSNPNEFIRRAAAEELAILMAKGHSLSAETLTRVRNEARGFWADAFDIVSNGSREKILSFLLRYDLNTASFNEARSFILRECEEKKIFFSDFETAAIEGHYAIVRSRGSDALKFFRGFQTGSLQNPNEKKWTEQIPEIFIDYPHLINYLGRGFQNTQSSGNEGVTLLTGWETNLSRKAEANQFKDCRYRLLYSAGRVARARGGLKGEGITLFEKALALAPDKDQSDICIWNILDLALGESTDSFVKQLERYSSKFYKGSYFDDVLERALQKMTAAQDWGKIIRAFSLINKTNADVSKAAFAWLIVRVIEEGLLSDANKQLAAAAVNTAQADVTTYAQIAYNASGMIGIPSLYYRARSASLLDLPLIEFSKSNNTAVNAGNSSGSAPLPVAAQSAIMEFLHGFFRNGAAHLANPYIRANEKDLSAYELRSFAQAYADQDMHPQAMRLAGIYINRESYAKERRDLELMFPRPFLKLTEKYANEFKIAPPLLFGLIRAESAFQHAIISHAGAVGLTQLMPATAKEMSERLRRSGGPNYTNLSNGLDLTDPELNVHIGTFYFNYLMGLFDDPQLALMAYNGGMNRVRRWQRANPKLPADLIVETADIHETRDYARRLIGFAAVYKELYYTKR